MKLSNIKILFLFYPLFVFSEEDIPLLYHEVLCENKEQIFKGVNDKDVLSLYNAGVMYSKGYCVKNNLELAYNLFANAANAGDMNSYFNVGLMVYMGYGVDRDVSKASKIFDQLIDNNYPKAAEFLCGTYMTNEFISSLPKLKISNSYSCVEN